MSAERIRESRFGGSEIGKQLNLSVVVMNVDRESGAGSHLYRGVVKDETDRKGPGICAESESGMGGKDGGELPAADQSVNEAIRVAIDVPAMAKRQIVNTVGREERTIWRITENAKILGSQSGESAQGWYVKR